MSSRSASIRPVILSGGGGTRLWPVSRTGDPKQFQRLFGDRSLLQATLLRCRDPDFAPPLIVTGEGQRFFVVDQLEEIGVDAGAIILEPVPRNTAPAIALAAFWALGRGEDDPLLVMPSDHMIDDPAALKQAVEAALPAALEGQLLTFGIRPTQPKTGYGYIHAGEPEAEGSPVRKVHRFVEKPSSELAVQFLEDGHFYWNSGIFLFQPSALVRALKAHSPSVAAEVERSMQAASIDGPLVRPEPSAFAAAQDISIDYAVMEHSADIRVVPVDFSWSDVGSWDAVRELMPVDAKGNAFKGDVIALDVSNSLIRSEGDLTVAAIGLDGILCVFTHDAAFLAPIDRAQDVKRIVEELRARGHPRADEPARVHRPWGTYQTMDRGERFQTKRIIVKPGGKLSLQKHQHRSEHWIVVNGTAEVTIDGQVSLLQENESVYIPAGTSHRLANPGTVPLHLIEVQCGPYLGEDDIIRLEDEYGRD
jgi:mannose-1-phosphate guanylyltransferase/mannose-6-phosphate isomerase